MGYRDFNLYGRSLKRPAWRDEVSSLADGHVTSSSHPLWINVISKPPHGLLSILHTFLVTTSRRNMLLISSLALGSFSLQLLEPGKFSFWGVT